MKLEFDICQTTTQAIGKIVKKFKETEVITNIEKPVHHRFARSTENIAIVSANVAKDRNVSIPRRSPKLRLSTAHYGVFCTYIHIKSNSLNN